MKICLTGYAHPFGTNSVYGAERQIWYLAQEYLKLGYEVTIISVNGCNLPGCRYIKVPKPWDDNTDIYYEAIEAEEAAYGKFDFIHSYQASGKIDNRLRDKHYCLEPFFGFSNFRENIISCSHCLNKVNKDYGTVIHYGIPDDPYDNPWLPDDYLAWVGRIDSGKAPHIAIEVAKRANKRLIIMGPSYHYPYFEEKIWPHIDNDQIIWLQGVTDTIKQRVLRKSLGFLSTNWNKYHEMFGIVNIEALASGVPVIGWGRKSEPSAINFNGGEIIEHGIHGFINEYDSYSEEDMEKSIDKAVEYVGQLDQIDRQACYELFKSKFTAKIMAEKHLKYYDIIKKRGKVHNVTKEL